MEQTPKSLFIKPKPACITNTGPVSTKDHAKSLFGYFKGIVSPDWKGLQMVSLDRFEV
jgi:hypothetical protein